MTNKYFAKSLSAPKNIKITKGAKITKAGFWDTMPYITEPEPVVRGASSPVDFVPTSLTGAPEQRMRGLAETPRIRSLVGGANRQGDISWNPMGPRVSPQFLGAAPRPATAPIRSRPLTTGMALQNATYGLRRGQEIPSVSIPDQMRQPMSALPLASKGRKLKIRSVNNAEIQRAIDSQVGGRDPIFSGSNGQYTDLLGRTYAPNKNGVLRLTTTNAAQSRFAGNRQLRFQRETRRNIDGLLKVNEDLRTLQANPPTTNNLYDIQEHSRAVRDLTSQRKQLETALQGRNITVPRPKDMNNLTPEELRARLFAQASKQPKGSDSSLAGVSRITTPRMQGIRGVDASGSPIDAPSLPYLDRAGMLDSPRGAWARKEKARIEALKTNPMFGMIDDMAGIPEAGRIRGASSPVDVPVGRNLLDDALSALYLSNGGQIPEGMFPLPDESYKPSKAPRRTTRGASSPVDEIGLRGLNQDMPPMPPRQPTAAEVKAGFLAPFVSSKQPSRPSRGPRGQAFAVNSRMDSAFDDAMMRDSDPTSRFVVGSDRPKTLQDYVDTGAISPAKAETIRTIRGASSPIGAPFEKPLYTRPRLDREAFTSPLNGPWTTEQDYLVQRLNNEGVANRNSSARRGVSSTVRGASSPTESIAKPRGFARQYAFDGNVNQYTPSRINRRTPNNVKINANDQFLNDLLTSPTKTRRNPMRISAVTGSVPRRTVQSVNSQILGNLLDQAPRGESIMERVGRRASSGLGRVEGAVNKLPRWAKLGATLAAGAGLYQLGKMNKSMAKSMLKSKHNNKYL